MGDRTGIEWTDATWNPVHGCSIVSTECRNCYAAAVSQRFNHTTAPWTSANAAQNVTLKPHLLAQPLRWQRPRRIFVNSMSDLFHELVPFEYIAAVFGIMAAAPRHTFQVLTKRPERALEFFAWLEEHALSSPANEFPEWKHRELLRRLATGHAFNAPGRLGTRVWMALQSRPPAVWPLPNVWIGVSIGQRNFVGRADLLRKLPAAVRFISAEPLIGPLIPDGPVDLIDTAPTYGRLTWADGRSIDENLGLDLDHINWLIVGGESGPHHRPIQARWVLDLLDACLNQRHDWEPGEGPVTAFFLKQWGGLRPGGPAFLEGREWREFPGEPENRLLATGDLVG